MLILNALRGLLAVAVDMARGTKCPFRFYGCGFRSWHGPAMAQHIRIAHERTR